MFGPHPFQVGSLPRCCINLATPIMISSRFLRSLTLSSTSLIYSAFFYALQFETKNGSKIFYFLLVGFHIILPTFSLNLFKHELLVALKQPVYISTFLRLTISKLIGSFIFSTILVSIFLVFSLRSSCSTLLSIILSTSAAKYILVSQSPSASLIG